MSSPSGSHLVNGQAMSDAHKKAQDDPIAIVGMACHFPQDAENAEKFWEMLLAGRSACTEFPKDRFNIDAHYHPDPAHGGSTSCRNAHFLKHKGSEFDAPFFSITKTEALSMDTQQRILMENVYQALENAGIQMDRVIGSETSVYVGAFTNDYHTLIDFDPESLYKYAPTGNSNSIASNRVSWFYDLKGCSLTVDTACSSSLVALHLACQNLRDGGARMSIVSGVNIIENPLMLYRMSHIGFLSPDGKCFSFDHRANGYSRGEGVGTVILKPLSAALADGNTIRAVIRATGVNQDGRTPGMTLPSKAAQESLIHSVYRDSGLDLSVTNYIEAHGTGTAVGDPIEAGAIAAAWTSRKSENPLYVGAVKSNIGHLEGASGVAGVIKTVWVLEKAIIPPNINFEKVNPKIQPERWNMEFPTRPMPWPAPHIRRASINSFGFGGTNAHAVLDDAYSYLNNRSLQGIHVTASSLPKLEDIKCTELDSQDADGSPISTPTANGHLNKEASYQNGATNGESPCSNLSSELTAKRVFVLSSFDESGIKRTAETYREYFSAKAFPDESKYLGDLAYSLATKRTMFPWKGYVVAESMKELVDRLPEASKTAKHTRKRDVPNLGFVFTGQGAQWHAMGRELLVYPVFSKSLEEASAYIERLGSPWNLLEELLKEKEDSNIDQPVLSQTSSTALQVALVDLLASWNISPSRVIGHSSGEIAAAYCAGALNRDSAWKIAYYRGVVSGSLVSRNGSMMAVGATQEVLLPYLEKVNDEMSGELLMACFNSPKNITVSGEELKVEKLRELLEADSMFARKLKVLNAYHSGHMRDVADEYLNLIGGISSSKGLDELNRRDQKVLMFSTVAGEQITLSELCNPRYWVKNLVSPVRFVQGLSEMCSTIPSRKTRLRVDQGVNIPLQQLVEIGPHPALNSAIRDTLSVEQSLSSIGYSYLMSRNKPALDITLATVGKLFCHGYPVDLLTANHLGLITDAQSFAQPQMLVDLPPYSFNHSQTYWPEGRLSKNFRFRKFPRHDILGVAVPDWNAEDPKWRNNIRVSENPWLKDHQVTGSVVFPGVAYLVMAIEAVKQLDGTSTKISGYRLRDISIKAALQIPETEGGIETALTMHHASESSLTSSSTWREFKVSSYNPNTDGWTEHCRGLIKVESESETGPVDAGREAAAEAATFHDELTNVLSTCKTPFDMSRSYSELDTIGLAFGPLFRNLTNVMRGDGTGDAMGTIKVPNIAVSMPKGFMRPHVIHPAAMDSMLHIFLAAIQDSAGGARMNEPMVPVFLKEVWVADDISGEPNHEFTSHGRAKKVSHNRVEAAITVWDSPAKVPKVLFKGIQVMPLQSASLAVGERQINYNVEWKPDVDLIDTFQSETYLRERLPDLDKEEILRSAEDFNLAATMYILDALKAIGDDTLDKLPVHLKKYLDWLRQQEKRFREGTILHQQPEWESVMSNPSLKEQVFKRVEEIGPEGQLATRIGTRIVPILRQEADALQLMFGDDLLDAYYRELHGTNRIHHLLHSYLDMYSHKYVNLKVLEIGAGTGGTTLPILETLSRNDKHSKLASYTYTDISPGFFEKAKAKFKNWRHVIEYRKLDIEKDPASQGFEQSYYDIVVAANVLHATADLKNTLRNVRSLLRPGGKLLLHEGVQLDLMSGPLAFGTLPGWWFSIEPFRKWGPLLNESGWNEILRENDFSGTDLALKDHPDDRIHGQSLMISTALDSTSCEMSVPETIIVTSSSESLHTVNLAVQSSVHNLGIPDVKVVHYRDLDSRNLKEIVCIVLVELDGPVLVDINEDDFKTMRHLLTTCAGLLWVTKSPASNPEVSLITGLVRTVRWERDLDTSNLITLGIEEASQPLATTVAQIAQIYKHQFLLQDDLRNAEYSSSGGIIHVNRLIHADYLDSLLQSLVAAPIAQMQSFRGDPNRALKLSTDSPGLLNKLQFTDCPKYHTELDPDEVEVEIKATGLNFRDIMSAMGEVGGDVFGAEGAGIVTRVGADIKNVTVNDRVALLPTRTGCFQTFARTTEEGATRIPDSMSFEIAAGLPVIFCTAYYCLVDIARLQKGESILIHAAAGGVGQAATMLAKNIGAEIFATVSTEEKKKILMDAYNIPEDHIFSSRDLSFAKGVMRLTNNRGIDVILNSLAGEALRRSWDCIAPFGRFVEIGKRDIYANGRLEMLPFSRNVIFASCDLETVMGLEPKTTSRLLQKTMSLWKEGLIKETTPFNVFDYSQIEASFRLVQSGKHIGKVVLTANQDDLVPVVPKSQPPYYFPEDATYVLSGGLGGLGRSMARWMVARGARHLIFLSRNGATTDAAQALVKELQEMGCEVKALACDVTNKTALEEAIAACERSMPPIKGCVQGAMQLKDSAFENMTWENFNATIAPKVHGSWNLHTVLPEDMDFFIMLSSICGIIGNRGQSNYAAGNTYQDALAHYRIRNNLPAVTLDLGSMLSVGFIAENQQTVSSLSYAVDTIREDEFHALLEYHMDSRNSSKTPIRCQVALGLTTSASFKRRGVPEPSFMSHPLFIQLQSISGFSSGDGEEDSFLAIRAALRTVGTLEDATGLIVETLIKRLSSIMSIPTEDIDSAKPIHHYGVDSLVAVEFRNWLGKSMEADIQVLDIMGNDSIAQLSEKIAKSSKLVKLDEEKSAEAASGDQGEAKPKDGLGEEVKMNKGPDIVAK